MSADDSEAFRWGPDSDWDEDPSDTVDDVVDDPDRSGLTWTVALLGVLYVVWALLWVVGLAQTPALTTGSAFDNAMYRLGEFLAYIAAPLWFVGVVWLGTAWSQKTRTGVLLLGLVVSIPWPYVLPVMLT